jgi:endonuclease/exonuclease/phosphatase family metal-dependent hydrolase
MPKDNKFLKVLRQTLTVASLLYLIVLCAVLYLLDHCLESEWYFSPLIYLPPQGWLLPLVVLTPLALFLRPWVLIFHFLAAFAVMLFFMHFYSPKTNAENVPADSVLTVVTANIGQRKTSTLQPFLDEMDPDVITFQEGVYPKGAFDAGNPGYEYRTVGEFTLASKLPILDAGLVPDVTFEGLPVAAWFELDYTNRPIVVYSVHMPTPRHYLLDLRGNGFMVSADRQEGIFSADVREEYRYYWSMRFELARGLIACLAKEKRPMIICGDFNTPDHGDIYQMFASHFTDVFANVGQGYGFTFPGDTHVAVAGYRPWLRLDYQFADTNWKPVEALVEPLKHAQHLAVSASYQLKDAK